MRIAGSEYFQTLSVVTRFDQQRGQPVPTDPLLGSDDSDPSAGTSGNVALPPTLPPGTGSNDGQVTGHHHRAHSSGDKPGSKEQDAAHSPATTSSPSAHIRRGGLIDVVA